MKTTLTRFESTDGLQLNGALFEPALPTDKIIVHVHGSGGNFYENKFLDSFAETYTQNGYAFLPFNNRGSGFIRDFRKRNDWITIGNENELFADCVFDIDGAVNFAKQRGFSEIILQGHSLGCNKIVFYASQRNFKGRLFLLAPCDVVELSTLKALSRTTAWKADSSIDLFRYRDGKVVPTVERLENKVLVLIGTADSHIKQEATQCFDYLATALKRAKSFDSCLVPDADHSYRGKEQEVAKKIAEWLGV